MPGHVILIENASVRSFYHSDKGVINHIRMDYEAELEGLKTLNPQVITTIHDRYFPQIYRFARYRLGDEVVAEDVAGEVFLRLLEAVHTGRGPQSNLGGWLMGTASNLVNDHFRKFYNRQQVELPDDDITNGTSFHEGNDPHELVEAMEEKQRVRQALSKLTEEQAQVITLRFGNKYNLEETARIMGKKANAIKALQFRALAALRRVLGGNEL